MFNEENLLYEMGLLVGTGENALASSIRNSDQQNADDDFNIISKASSVTDLCDKPAADICLSRFSGSKPIAFDNCFTFTFLN